MQIKLFTFYYPFGSSEQFLHDEVAYLSSQGVDLTLVPFEVKGKSRSLPDGMKVDTSLAKKLKQNSELKVYPLFRSFGAILKAVLQHKVRSVSGLRDVVGFAHHGKIIRDWASQNIEENEVLYTYWFERITYGIAQYLEMIDGSNLLVTRAHGYDLYAERRKHNFIPFRKTTLRRLDQVFTVSESGRKYLIANHGFDAKIQKSNLGIKDHGISTTESGDVVKVVSCSSIIPLKRVDLIAKNIKFFCQQNPSLKVEWDHFGEGNAEKVEQVLKEIPTNMNAILHGNISNEELITFYKNSYIDAFINLSTTEGLPVSIMEAISFGIPVIAVDVGGVSEIVNNSTGILLNQDFSLEDFEKGVSSVLDQKELRKSARKFFEDNFVAEHNYHSFYTQLKKLKS